MQNQRRQRPLAALILKWLGSRNGPAVVQASRVRVRAASRRRFQKPAPILTGLAHISAPPSVLPRRPTNYDCDLRRLPSAAPAPSPAKHPPSPPPRDRLATSASDRVPGRRRAR